MVLCLVLCNIGLLPAASPVYSTISKVFVPLAVPLLLLDADIRKCYLIAKRLLKAFVLGSLGTILGTVVAYWLVPMKSLQGGSKIAAALCARHIGGAVNFVAVAEILRVPPELVAAAIAADNLIVAIYFSFLFVISAPSTEYSEATVVESGLLDPSIAAPIILARDDGIKDVDIFELATTVETIPEPTVNGSSVSSPTTGCPMSALFGTDGGNSASLSPSASKAPSVAASQALPTKASKQDEVEVNLNSLSAALTASLLICTASMALSSLTSVSHMLLLSAITVFLATAFPAYVGGMSRAGGTLGVLFMQLFFAATGAVGHIPTVLGMASPVLVHTTVQIVIHFLFIMGAGRLLNLPFRELVLASNANVGGPTTASAMAMNKNWRALVLPALLTGVFGFAIATQIGVLVFQLLTKLWV
eukprot:gene28816-37824_t